MRGKKKRRGKRTAARRSAGISLVELAGLSPQERTLLTSSLSSGPRPYSQSRSGSGGTTGAGPSYSLPTEWAPLPLGPSQGVPGGPIAPALPAPGLPVYQAPPPSPPRSPGLNPSVPILNR